MTPEQALESLRLAVREMSLKADIHDKLAECVEIIRKALQPPSEDDSKGNA